MKKRLLYTVMSAVLLSAGCAKSADTISTLDDLKKTVTVTDSESVIRIPDIDDVGNADKYAVTIEGETCYFVEQEDAVLILPEENRDAVLTLFIDEDKLDEIHDRFQEFSEDDSIGASTLIYGNLELWFFRNSNGVPYMKIIF